MRQSGNQWAQDVLDWRREKRRARIPSGALLQVLIERVGVALILVNVGTESGGSWRDTGGASSPSFRQKK